MRIVLAMCAALMLMITIPAASAITVDGVIEDNEWNDNWAFGQTNNATAASEYDIYDVGDRLEVRQGGFGQDTTIWNAEDPKADAGTAPDFGDDIAQAGDSSGMDLLRVYGHYNVTVDTFYGLATVYGIPGDSDGDGNLDENCSNWNDCNGTAGPASAHPDQIGIGPEEVWRIRISQVGSPTAQIEVSNNNWTEINGVLDYNDIDARFNPIEGGVYEIAVTGIRDRWDIGPCQEPIKIEVQGSVEGDGPGEDTATAFIRFPCPDIMIKKYVSPDNSTWYDAQTQASGPIFDNSSDVYWRYNVTNIGDEPLVDVNVTDNKEGFICDIGDLAVSETEVCYYSGTVPDPCVPYSNVGTTNGIGLVSGVPVDDTDPAHYNCEEQPPNGVPTMTPVGLVALIGMLGFVALRRRD
ncbi:hypothetical protein MPF_1353 [Methanohalophilus portucalensis FDF-1]|nr:hypothetical protein MPF_1353 [Methanohalophilus portucalensis FDF-1]